MRARIGIAAAALALAGCASAPQAHDAPVPVANWRTVAPENLVLLETKTGMVAIELATEAAPRHAGQFRAAVRSGVFDGEYFYRVVEGHVAQAGLEFDQRLGDWPTLPLEAERTAPRAGFAPLGNADLFAATAGHRNGFAAGREGNQEWLLNCPGALGMARNAAPDSGSIEFFIPLAPRRYLDRNYTVFGRVIAGMDNIHRLKRVDPVDEDAIPAFFDTDPAVAEAAFAARAVRLGGNQIVSVSLAADLPESDRPTYQVMATPGTEWEALKTSKRDYASIDAFVHTPPQVLDVCSLPVPARKTAGEPDA
ncbi:peptidylprolyl isomerase [Hyphomonas johnsonii]|uniref:peptidylprolyl isomerase n=1 Tax=Hyphomonas johnsonii MHS-2 TaxID=1280950 RepID=A0A059FJD7_9PROT|nr:peptidylprolyl isomerase [Hyphomonas johnsonii]KCZ90641.1 cyclophilin type peptidyl-prolyl cis-trans isomerase [Hyphomonas johnsonii MHS-2]